MAAAAAAAAAALEGRNRDVPFMSLMSKKQHEGVGRLSPPHFYGSSCANEVRTSKRDKRSLQKRNIMIANMENNVISAAFLKDKSGHFITKTTEMTLNNSNCKYSHQNSQTLVLAPHN